MRGSAPRVTGLDLSRPLDPATRSRINTLFVDNVVLCFRGQSFDRPETFIRAAGNLGRPMAPVTATWRLAGFDVVEELANHATDKRTGGNQLLKRGGSWHTDHSNLEVPPKATVLYAIDVPEEGGNTEFTNLFLAYDALDDATRTMIRGRRGLSRLPVAPRTAKSS